ncbi:MAG: hypothetical protein AB7N76_12535 [Planctomycetota bacterium]
MSRASGDQGRDRDSLDLKVLRAGTEGDADALLDALADFLVEAWLRESGLDEPQGGDL